MVKNILIKQTCQRSRQNTSYATLFPSSRITIPVLSRIHSHTVIMPINTIIETETTSLQYPRTGKRGVPQQFPRRLYEMLQSESKLLAASADHPKIIFWSESGKAFRIADVADFSATILPKYFRTKKFSSFQRNLNLVSFPFFV